MRTFRLWHLRAQYAGARRLFQRRKSAVGRGLGRQRWRGAWPSWRVRGLLARNGYTSNSRRCPGGLQSIRVGSMRSVRCPERSSPIWHGPTNMHRIERHGARRGAISGSAPPPGHGSAMTDCRPWMSLFFSYRCRFPKTPRSGCLVASSEASMSLCHLLRRQPVHCPMAGICGSRNTPRPRSRLLKRSARPARPRIWLDNDTDTFEQVAASRGVVTVNSSVGIQAFYFDKPVVVCGQTFWSIPGNRDTGA